MCCLGKINQHHLSFSLHPTCHRFYDRSRWIIQKSNKCLFAGSPHLTFLPGKTLSQKPLVIPLATSGWSTAVSTFQSAVACSGTHIAHHNNQFLNENQTDVGVFGNYSPDPESIQIIIQIQLSRNVTSFDWSPCLLCRSGIIWDLFELMKCSTVLTTLAMSVSTHFSWEWWGQKCSYSVRGQVSHVDSQVQTFFTNVLLAHKVQTSNNSNKCEMYEIKREFTQTKLFAAWSVSLHVIFNQRTFVWPLQTSWADYLRENALHNTWGVLFLLSTGFHWWMAS